MEKAIRVSRSLQPCDSYRHLFSSRHDAARYVCGDFFDIVCKWGEAEKGSN